MPTQRSLHLTSICFKDFKALRDFSLALGPFTALVGPNNSGKSTAISALRVLAAALPTASRRSPELLPDLGEWVYGYRVPREAIPVTLENAVTNLADGRASVAFRFSTGNELVLHFTSLGQCYLVAEPKGRPIRTPAHFRQIYPFELVVVPVLGQFDDNEEIIDPARVRFNLNSHRASRNFRNYWRNHEAEFEAFSKLLAETWPGVTVELPALGFTDAGTRLVMTCREGQEVREIFWMGFGFQIWCQLLTHLLRATHSQLVVIDEPEIYLHPELQRQLLALLRSLPADVVLATHSSDIIAECDPDEVATIDKRNRSAQRLRTAGDLTDALKHIGSSQTIVLSQIARTRRALLVEGEDFQVLSGLARRLGHDGVAAQSGFAVLQTGGFPTADKVRTIATTLTGSLDGHVEVLGLFDRDYRCQEELDELCSSTTDVALVRVLEKKEIENYLLVPAALHRAVTRLLSDRALRDESNPPVVLLEDVEGLLDMITVDYRPKVVGQLFGKRKNYFRRHDDATVMESVESWLSGRWDNLDARLGLVPGKDVLREVNVALQERYRVSLTKKMIIRALMPSEIAADLQDRIKELDRFRYRPTHVVG